MCAPWVNLEVPINCVLLLCIIRTLEFVYFSFFFGVTLLGPNG